VLEPNASDESVERKWSGPVTDKITNITIIVIVKITIVAIGLLNADCNRSAYMLYTVF
jgi:uncharacterized membrane protein YiaA